MRVEAQNFTTIETSELLDTARRYKEDGYRFVQCCADRVEDGLELTYSFDKDRVLQNVHLRVPEGAGVESISALFPAAFVFENETHDLFGIEIANISIDFHGTFYQVREETPMTATDSSETE